MRRNLVVSIVASPLVDDKRLDQLTVGLRRDLAHIKKLYKPTEGIAPEGAKAFDAATLGQLAVALTEAATILVPLIEAARDWLNRQRDAETIIFEARGHRLELSKASAAERERLIMAWIAAVQKEPDIKTNA